MSKKRNRRFSTVLMIAGLVLILAASSLVVYNTWDEKRADTVVAQVLEELDALEGEQDSVSEAPASKTDMPSCTLDSGTYIGVLSVPTLGLRLPVMQEWNYPNLRVAPCRYTGSVYTRDMVIAAHNYSSHFGMLDQLQPGDEVQFTDMGGRTFRYTVVQTETVMPTQIEQMITGEWDLTLFTCNYSGRARVTVRCNLN